MNLGDADEVKTRAKELNVSQRQKLDALSTFLGTTAGRSWMYETLARMHLFQSSFSPDPYVTAFNEGVRSAGLALVADISQACPKFYLEMLSERLEKDTVDAARRK